MSDWYRTVVWIYGSSFFLIIIYAQIIDWINPQTTARWIFIVEFFVILIGFVIGYFLDKYYRKRELKSKLSGVQK